MGTNQIVSIITLAILVAIVIVIRVKQHRETGLECIDEFLSDISYKIENNILKPFLYSIDTSNIIKFIYRNSV